MALAGGQLVGHALAARVATRFHPEGGHESATPGARRDIVRERLMRWRRYQRPLSRSRHKALTKAAI